MGVSLCPVLAQSLGEPPVFQKIHGGQANRSQGNMGPLGQAASQAKGRNVTYLLGPIPRSDRWALEQSPGKQCILLAQTRVRLM